ncbi:minor capsid protein [Chryseobacterium indologenes]|uniref:phage minor head protein n=1 Tax=Chryseobacterium indologenes TaxID=253 RepID=UPI001D0D6B38|nr:phage minor head protein [Chryseobacterium indologenes]UDQ55011.1 minor capsid protein [Chryseobacterium indologenes]
MQSWKEFEYDAYLMDGEYNNRWLETEFNQTIATVNMAAKFEDFQRDKDLYPNLKFTIINDARVRPEHKILDGIIKPVDDVFWSTHLPPLDWGCRCGVEQTDEEPTEGVPADDGVREEFKNNPVKTGKIFLSEAYSLDLTEVEKDQTSIKSLKLLAHNSDSSLQQFAREQVCELPRGKQFEVIQESKKGKISEHILLNKGEDYPNIKNVAEQFLKNGSKEIELMPEINSKSLNSYRDKIFPGYDHNKNPDLRIDGTYYDVKRVETMKNVQRNANRASEQKAIAVIDYQGDDLTEEKMKQQAKRIFGKNNINDKGEHNYPGDTLYFSHKGKLYKYNRE